jgi:hypothetical protein
VFSAGNYKHIIFNLSLQEGWDDPACAFAYIDKSMRTSGCAMPHVRLCNCPFCTLVRTS